MSAGKHLVFIVNPKSGTDRVKAMEAAIKNTLDAAQFTYELQHTRYVKHGIELARKAAQEGAFAVIAVGGDGSVNDVANGLQGTDTALGIIPKGSGNGMARTIGLPLHVERAIGIINRGNTIRMDLGFVNGRLFVSNAGVGFDALVAKGFADSKRRGIAAYSWLVTKHLWTYRAPQYRIVIDDSVVAEQAFLINIANGQQFGYNFKIAPQASVTDGLLDVIIIRDFPRILGGSLVARAMLGNITRSPFVRHYRGRKITIVHPQLTMLQTDGDPHPCDHSLHFTVQAGALKVLAP